MKDLIQAKEVLRDETIKIAIVNEGEIVYFSRDRGIKPIYSAVTRHLEALKGASLADRVIGRAAAMLCAFSGIESVHCGIISESGLKVLTEHGIAVSYDKKVPFIKNRTGDGMCPVEAMSLETDAKALLLEKIRMFLTNMGAV